MMGRFVRVAICLGVVALGFAVVRGLTREAVAAPPPGGFPFELVIDQRTGAGSVTIYRFRDGPRVCYVATGDPDSISCVVSPP